MRSGRIEIAQDRDAPVRVGLRQVAQEVLDDALGAPVHVLRAQRRVFRHGQVFRLPIDRGRRAEHERGHARLAHHFGQRQRATDIDVVIGERPRLRFPHGFEPGTVNDGGNRVVMKRRAQRRDVPDIRSHARDRPAGQRLQSR